ncbi:MAG: hypothetical protein ACXWUL_08680, partial [Caldimonas sp.]
MIERSGFARERARPVVIWLVVAGLALAAAILLLAQPRVADAEADDAMPVRTASLEDTAARPIASALPEEPAPSTPERPSGTELIEVCGLGWVEPDTSGAWSPAASTEPDVVARQRALLESIRRDDGE